MLGKFFQHYGKTEKALFAIMCYLPSKELIEKDKKQLHSIIKKTRIFFGVYCPISYQMIKSLVPDKGLDYYYLNM